MSWMPLRWAGTAASVLPSRLLMEGSYVYDVRFYNELNVEVFVLYPVNLKKAEAILDAIRAAMTY